MAYGRKTGGGSRKGIPNQKTGLTIEYIQKVLDAFPADQLVADIYSIKNPAQRVPLLIDLFEFILPKLSRVTQVGDPNAPNVIEVIYIEGTNIPKQITPGTTDDTI